MLSLDAAPINQIFMHRQDIIYYLALVAKRYYHISSFAGHSFFPNTFLHSWKRSHQVVVELGRLSKFDFVQS